MKVLITGGTRTVGRHLLEELQARNVDVRVLTRKNPEPGKLPSNVEIAVGDMLDPASLEPAMEGVDKLFLLNAVSAEELTQALIRNLGQRSFTLDRAAWHPPRTYRKFAVETAGQWKAESSK